MIELKCWGCGWDGHVPDHYAGLRVTCKRCGDVNLAPYSVTKEVDVDAWIAAIDPESESSTTEINISPLRCGVPPITFPHNALN
jgi:hypothetical protein